jgi:predicted amidohydrolase YtcJ
VTIIIRPIHRFPLLILGAQDELDADPIIKGRPVVLQSKDCHALWVSHRVLELSAPFPASVEGGVILRDESGVATGLQKTI